MKKQKEFEKYYKDILTVSAIVAVAAIAVGVFYRVSLGIFIAIIAAALYVVLVNMGLKDRFNLGYKRNGDGITVFSKGGASQIPEKLMFLDVTEIAAGKDSFGETVRIPKSILRIDLAAFTDVRTVEFAGTEEEWSRIDKKGEAGEWSLVFFPENSDINEINESEK